MTALTDRKRPADARVPGVYFAPQPRAPESPYVRTDVAGFVGFDPRRGAAIPEDPVERHRPICCDDWNDYLVKLQITGQQEDNGSLLGAAVRAYFMNGGRRCYVALIAPPKPDVGDDVERVRRELVGVRGAGESQATGLERLLMIDEVAILDVPDLYARRTVVSSSVTVLGGSRREAGFLPCSQVRGAVGAIPTRPVAQSLEPWFPADLDAADDPVFQSQREMILRCVDERWRVLLLLNVPWLRESSAGEYSPPSPDAAARWRNRFDKLVASEGFAEAEEMSCAALYYPWVLAQERVDAPIRELPATSFVAGVVARRDLARGPHVAPANESLRGVVQLTWPVDDEVQARLDPPDTASETGSASVNVLRAFPGFGVQVWGARTLSTDPWLRYLSVRRSLTAIQRRVKMALDTLLFEPNTPILRLQVTQVVFSTLARLYEAGALRGERIEQAFFVRCDASTNSLDDVQAGRLVCEVGVAIAAPAEFIVFRLGRREGVVEVIE